MSVIWVEDQEQGKVNTPVLLGYGIALVIAVILWAGISVTVLPLVRHVAEVLARLTR